MLYVKWKYVVFLFLFYKVDSRYHVSVFIVLLIRGVRDFIRVLFDRDMLLFTLLCTHLIMSKALQIVSIIVHQFVIFITIYQLLHSWNMQRTITTKNSHFTRDINIVLLTLFRTKLFALYNNFFQYFQY